MLLENNSPILVLQMGLFENVGMAFEKLFNALNFDCEVCKVASGMNPHRPLESYAGIVVTGSNFMVTDNLPWSVAFARLLVPVIQRGQVPILGICYGHQLLAHELNGSPIECLQERQIGSREMHLTCEANDDLLFSSLVHIPQDKLVVHVYHHQVVKEPCHAGVVLAFNDVDRCHALRLGTRCWSTQFHPEMKARFLRKVIAIEKKQIEERNHLNFTTVLDSVSEEGDVVGITLLERFAWICRQPRNHNAKL